MKRLEILLILLAAIGLFLKIFLFPGGDFMVGISLTTLALIYYPIGFFYFNSIPIRKIFKKDSYKEMTILRGIGAFGGGLAFSMMIIGILFKLLQLPGSVFMLNTGLMTGIFLLAVVAFKYFDKRNKFYKRFAVRALIIVCVSGVLTITSDIALVKIFYRNNPDYIKAYEKAANNPQDKELQIKAEEARQKMYK